MKKEPHVFFVGILVEVVDAAGVDMTGAPDETMHFIPFFK